MLRVRTVLHATDLSESSGAAFRLACTLAQDYGARLLVLHVEPPPVAVATMESAVLLDAGGQEDLMKQLRALGAHDPGLDVEYRLEQGDPATEILRVAKDSKCDVVVVGTHGRKGLGRLLLGSVAELVVRAAPCPVVTVKPMLHKAEPLGRKGERRGAPVRQEIAEAAVCGAVVR